MPTIREALGAGSGLISEALGGTGLISENIQDYIDGIETEGITPTGTLTITESGKTVDVTQYAQVLIDVPAYVLDFDSNGGTGQMPPHAYAKGSSVRAGGPDERVTPPTGKKFAFWGATKTATEDIGTFVMTSDKTLYAIWEDVQDAQQEVS